MAIQEKREMKNGWGLGFIYIWCKLIWKLGNTSKELKDHVFGKILELLQAEVCTTTDEASTICKKNAFIAFLIFSRPNDFICRFYRTE